MMMMTSRSFKKSVCHPINMGFWRWTREKKRKLLEDGRHMATTNDFVSVENLLKSCTQDLKATTLFYLCLSSHYQSTTSYSLLLKKGIGQKQVAAFFKNPWAINLTLVQLLNPILFWKSSCRLHFLHFNDFILAPSPSRFGLVLAQNNSWPRRGRARRAIKSLETCFCRWPQLSTVVSGSLLALRSEVTIGKRAKQQKWEARARSVQRRRGWQ